MKSYTKFVYSWAEVPLIIDIPFMCVLTGYGPEQLSRLCRQGKIPAFQIGKSWRIQRDDLKEWIENSKGKGAYIEARESKDRSERKD